MWDILTNLKLYTRILQVISSIIIFADSAYILSKGRWWGAEAFGLALFAGVTGMMVSILMIAGPPLNAVLAERLPGFIDIILSGILALFFLSAGGSIAAYGSCDSWYWSSSVYYSSSRFYTIRGSDRSWNNYCTVWTVVLVFCFLNFALYAGSTVMAGLDLMNGRGLIKPRGYASQGLPITTTPPNAKYVIEPYATHTPEVKPAGLMAFQPIQKPPAAAAPVEEP